jgi:adenylate cyclase class 2
MAQGGREIEIKIAVRDARTARRLLRLRGFRVWKRRVFEKNIVFDTPDLQLRNNSKLLRLREAHEVTLTYKGPPTVARHKSREEVELQISDARAMAAIVEHLGFAPIFRYEKYRTEFQLPGETGVVTIDETPIGVFIEIEGTPRWIDKTARNLEFTPADYVTASYSRLYLQWCETQGVQPTNMVFGS